MIIGIDMEKRILNCGFGDVKDYRLAFGIGSKHIVAFAPTWQ